MEKVKFPKNRKFPRNPTREPDLPRINVALLGCLRRQGVWESVHWYLKFLSFLTRENVLYMYHSFSYATGRGGREG